VTYDEVDLPLGTLRLRPGGGSAGHKGMVSIIDRLGTQEFRACAWESAARRAG